MTKQGLMLCVAMEKLQVGVVATVGEDLLPWISWVAMLEHQYRLNVA